MSTAGVRRESWILSASLHGALVVGAVFLIWHRSEPSSSVVPFEVYENPSVGRATSVKPLEAKPQPPREEPKKRAVYGATRSTLTSNAGDVAAKAGNTLAKENDDKKLKDSDADALPIPTEDYLISAMPRLKKEIRIPYPPEAKKAGIQGAVVFDLLIDANGVVRQSNLIAGPGYGLNEAALQAIGSFEFEPARVGDQAVAVRIRYSYRFVLEK